MKLRFRAIEPADAELFYAVENDEDSWADSDTFAPYSYNILRKYAENYTADPVADNQLRLILEDADSHTPLGIVDFYELSFIHNRSFLGIYILPEHRKQGVGTKAIHLACSYAKRKLGLRLFGAKILDTNPVSLHLFEKCGFEINGRLLGWQIIDGDPHDLFILTRFI